MMGGACALTGPDKIPPQLVSVQVLEGEAPCRGCPVSGSGQNITPGADNVLTIKPNTVYTFRAVVRTSGDFNQCVYNIFKVSWEPPDRTWDCVPEFEEEITIDKVTGRNAAPITDADKVTLSLAEWTIDRREHLSTTELRTYTVRFPPEPEGDGLSRRP